MSTGELSVFPHEYQSIYYYAECVKYDIAGLYTLYFYYSLYNIAPVYGFKIKLKK